MPSEAGDFFFGGAAFKLQIQFISWLCNLPILCLISSVVERKVVKFSSITLDLFPFFLHVY
jgi:hypothetical protein